MVFMGIKISVFLYACAGFVGRYFNTIERREFLAIHRRRSLINSFWISFSPQRNVIYMPTTIVAFPFDTPDNRT
jgi:hypothetical protein